MFGFLGVPAQHTAPPAGTQQTSASRFSLLMMLTQILEVYWSVKAVGRRDLGALCFRNLLRSWQGPCPKGPTLSLPSLCCNLLLCPEPPPFYEQIINKPHEG